MRDTGGHDCPLHARFLKWAEGVAIYECEMEHTLMVERTEHPSQELPCPGK